MIRYLMPALLWIASTVVFAQDAATIAAQREAEERDRRTSALIENLQQANQVQQRRINELNNDMAALRRQVVDLENRFKNSQIGAVTGSDVRKVYDKMAEIEKNRQADNNLVKEQFGELKKLLDKPAVIVAPPVTPSHTDTKPPKNDPQPADDVPEFTGEYYPYKVNSGDTLLKILAAYNAKLKENGKTPVTLEQVKKANPKINPNSLPVGREIKIPVPPGK